MTKFREELNNIMISHGADSLEFMIKESTPDDVKKELFCEVEKLAIERVSIILEVDNVDEDNKSVFVYSVDNDKVEVKLAYVVPSHRGKGILSRKLDELHKTFKRMVVVQTHPDFYIPRVLENRLPTCVLIHNGGPCLGFVVRGWKVPEVDSYSHLERYKDVISYLQDSTMQHEDVIALIAYDHNNPEVGILEKVRAS